MRKYAYNYGKQDAINHFKLKYAQYTFVHTIINKLTIGNVSSLTRRKMCHHQSSINLGDAILLEIICYKKINKVVIGVRSPRAVTSRKTVISIVDRVLKANDPNTLSEFCSTITSTDNWAAGISQSMDWVQTNRTTGKEEPSTHLLVQEKFTFQKAISTIVTILINQVISSSTLVRNPFLKNPLGNIH